MSTILLESKAAYDTMMKVILGVPIAILLVEACVIASKNAGDVLVLAPAFALIGFIFWSVLPRKYIIYNDRTTIILGGPFSVDIAFSTIKSARKPKGIGFTMNFAGSSASAVELVREKWLSVVISAVNRDIFIEQLEKALLDWKVYNGA